MIVHGGYKVLSDMPKFVFYLYENFKTEMVSSGQWPKKSQDELVYYLDWYSTKLRPFMWEFYGIMTATNQAGLRNVAMAGPYDDDKSSDAGSIMSTPKSRSNIPLDLELAHKQNSHLQKIHDEYMTRFKFMCEQIEIKFFKGTNSFIFGDKPSCIDHIFYQELLAAMILSGNGTQ